MAPINMADAQPHGYYYQSPCQQQYPPLPPVAPQKPLVMFHTMPTLLESASGAKSTVMQGSYMANATKFDHVMTAASPASPFPCLPQQSQDTFMQQKGRNATDSESTANEHDQNLDQSDGKLEKYTSQETHNNNPRNGKLESLIERRRRLSREATRRCRQRSKEKMDELEVLTKKTNAEMRKLRAENMFLRDMLKQHRILVPELADEAVSPPLMSRENTVNPGNTRSQLVSAQAYPEKANAPYQPQQTRLTQAAPSMDPRYASYQQQQPQPGYFQQQPMAYQQAPAVYSQEGHVPVDHGSSWKREESSGSNPEIKRQRKGIPLADLLN